MLSFMVAGSLLSKICCLWVELVAWTIYMSCDLNDAAPSYRPGGRRLAWNAHGQLSSGFSLILILCSPRATPVQPHPGVLWPTPTAETLSRSSNCEAHTVEAVSLLCILGGIFARPVI